MRIQDVDWKRLKHAYGSAEDIPELLEEAEKQPFGNLATDDPWYSLGDALCHQYTIYPAAYATVPFFAEYAMTKPPKQRENYLVMICAVEIYRHKKSASDIPVIFVKPYEEALKTAYRLAKEFFEAVEDENQMYLALSMLATFRGYYRLGNAIMNYDPLPDCPECGAEIEDEDYFVDSGPSYAEVTGNQLSLKHLFKHKLKAPPNRKIPLWE